MGDGIVQWLLICYDMEGGGPALYSEQLVRVVGTETVQRIILHVFFVEEIGFAALS